MPPIPAAFFIKIRFYPVYGDDVEMLKSTNRNMLLERFHHGVPLISLPALMLQQYYCPIYCSNVAFFRIFLGNRLWSAFCPFHHFICLQHMALLRYDFQSSMCDFSVAPKVLIQSNSQCIKDQEVMIIQLLSKLCTHGSTFF